MLSQCHMSYVPHFFSEMDFPNSLGFIYRCFVIAGKLLGTPLATPHKVWSWKDEFFLEKKVGHFHGLAYLEILLASFLHKYFPRCDVQTMDLCGCSTGTQFGVHCWDSHVLFWFGFTCAIFTVHAQHHAMYLAGDVFVAIIRYWFPAGTSRNYKLNNKNLQVYHFYQWQEFLYRLYKAWRYE